MKIAFDSTVFYMQRYGGVSRYFVRLASHLHGMGQHTRVFCPLYFNHLLKEQAHHTFGRFFDRMPDRLAPAVRTVNRVAGSVAIGCWKPDVVHETWYHPCRSAGRSIPTVITVHDMIQELLPDSFSSQDPTVQRKRICAKRASHVICVSENTRKDLLKLIDLPEEKVSVIHLGIDRPPDPAEAIQSRSRKRPFLLYVGDRHAYKNFQGFMKSVAAIRSVRDNMDVVAFGGGPFTTFEKEFLSRLGFAREQVSQMTGDDAALDAAYRSAEFLVYPSLYEGFGLPPLEAMARGCPVLASNVSSIPEVCGNAAEYFDPHSIGNMGSVIERALENSGARKELVLRGYARVNHFSWDRCAEKTLEIYKSIRN